MSKFKRSFQYEFNRTGKDSLQSDYTAHKLIAKNVTKQNKIRFVFYTHVYFELFFYMYSCMSM